MTSQSHFAGMDPVLGQMHEQTFTIAPTFPLYYRPGN